MRMFRFITATVFGLFCLKGSPLTTVTCTTLPLATPTSTAATSSDTTLPLSSTQTIPTTTQPAPFVAMEEPPFSTEEIEILIIGSIVGTFSILLTVVCICHWVKTSEWFRYKHKGIQVPLYVPQTPLKIPALTYNDIKTIQGMTVVGKIPTV